MENKRIDEIFDMAEYLAFMRLKLLAGFYIPYLSWGLYTLICGLLNLGGHFLYWIYLWIPAAFFSSLDPDFKNLKPNLIVWIISGVIFYALVYFLNFSGFFIGIAVASTLGYGVLPIFFGGRKKKQRGGYIVSSIGLIFLLVVFAIIAQIFTYKLWQNPALFPHHFSIMVAIFYGVNYAFTRARILAFWSLVLILVCAITGFKGMNWYIPLIVLSISAIHIGIYGLLLRKKIKREVES